MSSQGPAAYPNTGTYYGPGLTGATGSYLPKGYAFNKNSIRDASDWISYKKQAMIYNSSPAGPTGTQSNDFRLEWENGKYKCTSCNGSAF